MATNFPASLDSLTNPSSSDSLNSPSHSAQHANSNDAIEALQAKVGADSSAVTSSLDYKVAQLETLGTATAFTPSWTNLTPGNATETWYYTQVNDLILVQGQTLFGSTTSITGAVQMNHPIGSAIVENMIIGHSYCVGGGDLRIGMSQATPGEITPYVFTIDGTYIDRAQITATSPFTWASGYSLRMSYIYQLA